MANTTSIIKQMGRQTVSDQKTEPNIKYIVGIDEAGRGPLAGPVSVGAVVIAIESSDFSGDNFSAGSFSKTAKKFHPLFSVAKDSKVLSPSQRDFLFNKIKQAKKEVTLDYAVSCVSSKIIDSHGIVWAIRLATARTLEKLSVLPHETLIFLDGSLKAPDHFLFQETIIRGDATVPIISLASIAAKVVRDKKMIRLASRYPDFDFQIHKGYGTLAHRKLIKKFGPCDIHRQSFLRSILT